LILNTTYHFRAAFAALLFFVFSTNLFAKVEFDYDLNITKKTESKIKEIANELYNKTKISTVIVAQKELNREDFLTIKNNYLKELKDPYILWIFAKKYIDTKSGRVGKLNILLSSDDLKGKFDESSLFSPFSGTFTKIIVIQKSKSDPTSAAFLNGYSDLADMLSKSFKVKLNSNIGNESRETINIVRVVVYISFMFFFLWYIKVKFFR